METQEENKEVKTETNQEYLARILPLFKKPIPHSWRVQSYSKQKPVATVMAYIDQRDLMDVLDAYCTYGWQKKYEEIAGNLFCSIGVDMPDGTVQWRSDCGVESQSDAEKGRASDAAKRAGVNWGIGRFLYDMKIQYVDADAIKGDGDKTVGDKVYKKFPNVVDKQGRKIWDLTQHINGLNPNAPVAPKTPVQVAEPSVKEKAAQMTPAPTPLTDAEVKEHEEKIKAIKTPDGLAGYFRSLTTDVQANKKVIDALGARRKELTVVTA